MFGVHRLKFGIVDNKRLKSGQVLMGVMSLLSLSDCCADFMAALDLCCEVKHTR